MHNRRTIRFKGFDYSQNGVYFITVCTDNRASLFGNIKDGIMILNACGEIVRDCWMDIPEHYPDVIVDKFVVMPNHLHGILVIDNGAQNVEPIQEKSLGDVGDQYLEPPLDEVHGTNIVNRKRTNRYQHIIPSSIGAIVRGFKIGVNKRLRDKEIVYNVWQRNYFEHVIYYEREYKTICQYIDTNAIKWLGDKYYEEV